ncbi:winged helix-turn-helix protein [Eilatimonas milleporae]|uniref:Winged helix-turn-helix protein n=1 Tax=Eilatimonas milleporae TaxID=911205 RepID=A0A3M0C6G5_9PROT|nr:winged helix-turn-helix domain-containing protein [Eilatimonas milleporae]RMB04832.1 winged helix-turn-helix protein [Eilatimonas milleporae]
MEAYGGEIIALIEETQHITLGEIAAHLEKNHGVKVVKNRIWRLLDRRGWTYKTAHAAERQRADVLRPSWLM